MIIIKKKQTQDIAEIILVATIQDENKLYFIKFNYI